MWGAIINTILGLWLMSAPGIFQYESAAANNGHIIGPIIVTFAIVSIWEATRGVRKWNFVMGAWLLIAPWILGYESSMAIISNMATGVLVIIFAMVKGKIEQQFGGGWTSLWQKHPKHIEELKSNKD